MNTVTMLVAQAAASGGSPFTMLLMMVGIFLVMWLFMIRPQQKKQKKIREFQNALKEGDNVVLAGGMYGVIKRIDMTNGKAEVEIARGVVVTVDKGHVFADVQAFQQAGK